MPNIKDELIFVCGAVNNAVRREDLEARRDQALATGRTRRFQADVRRAVRRNAPRASSSASVCRAYETAGWADLYDFLPVDTVRLHQVRAQQRQQSSKQFTVEPWERHVVQLAASALGVEQPLMLHPSWMYQLLTPAWQDKMAWQQVARWLNPQPLPVLPLPEGLKLPEQFIAVRFYARATMQPHDGVIFWLKRQLERLAEKQPLIFLSADDRYDDHADFLRPFGANMVDLRQVLVSRRGLVGNIDPRGLLGYRPGDARRIV